MNSQPASGYRDAKALLRLPRIAAMSIGPLLLHTQRSASSTWLPKGVRRSFSGKAIGEAGQDRMATRTHSLCCRRRRAARWQDTCRHSEPRVSIRWSPCATSEARRYLKLRVPRARAAAAFYELPSFWFTVTAECRAKGASSLRTVAISHQTPMNFVGLIHEVS
jgi:hypothetical protein